jgi:transcriptional regulator with XRE-family HTH domain
MAVMSTNGKGAVGGETELRSMRRAAGLSQQRVAELAGCSLQAVALYERGYQPETSAVLPRIRAVLNDERPVTTPGAVTTSDAGMGDDRVRSG